MDSRKPTKILASRCDACDELVKLTELFSHVRHCAHRKQYGCKHCSEEFNVKLNLDLHSIMHSTTTTGSASGQTGSSFSCAACDRRFSRLASFRCHLRLHLVDETLRCDQCGDEFDYYGIKLQTQLRCHERRAHGIREVTLPEPDNAEGSRLEAHSAAGHDPNDSQMSQDNYRNRDNWEECLDVFVCRDCGCMSSSADDARDHEALHKRLRAAITSSRVIKKRRKQSRHNIHNINTKATQSISTTAKVSGSRKRKQTATNRKAHVCEVCNQSFSRKSSLNRHAASVHTGIRAYVCVTCGKAFQQQGSLSCHMQTHNEHKPFACDICDMTFTQRGNLRRHIAKLHDITQSSASFANAETNGVETNPLPTLLCPMCPCVFSGLNKIIAKTSYSISVVTSRLDAPLNSGSINKALDDQNTQAIDAPMATDNDMDTQPVDENKVNGPCTKAQTKSDQVRALLARITEAYMRRVQTEQSLTETANDVLSEVLAKSGILAANSSTPDRAAAKCALDTISSAPSSSTNNNQTTLGNISEKLMRRAEESQQTVCSGLTQTHTNANQMTSRPPNSIAPQNSNHKDQSTEKQRRNVGTKSKMAGTGRRRLADSATKAESVLYRSVKDMKLGTHRYECLLCPYKTKYEHDMARHTRVHSGIKPYPCAMCNMRFSTTHGLGRHLRCRAHLDLRTHRCGVCTRELSSAWALKKHMRLHERRKHNQTTALECCTCDRTFKSSRHLAKHKLNCNEQTILDVDVVNETQPLYERVDGHVTSMRPAGPAMCNQYGMLLTDHAVTGRYLHKCDQCPAIFKKASHLRDHKQTHNGLRLYKCTRCPMSFTWPRCLRDHIRRHVGVRQNRCVDCNKWFFNQSQLRRHRVVHTNYCPFICPFCAKRFKLGTRCRRHIRAVHRNQSLPQPAPVSEPAPPADVLDYNNEVEMDSSSADNSPEPIHHDIDTEHDLLHQPLIHNNSALSSTHHNHSHTVYEADNGAYQQTQTQSYGHGRQVFTPAACVYDDPHLQYDWLYTQQYQQPYYMNYETCYQQGWPTGSQQEQPQQYYQEHTQNGAGNASNVHYYEHPVQQALLPQQQEELADLSSVIADVFNTETSNQGHSNTNNQHKQAQLTTTTGNSGKQQQNVNMSNCAWQPSTNQQYQLAAQHQQSTTRVDKQAISTKDSSYEQYNRLMGDGKLNKQRANRTCDFCGKTFQKPSDLVRHERIHTGALPYECSVCNRRFRLESTLITHMKVHAGTERTGIVQCGVCLNTYMSRGALKTHMRVHTGNLPFACEKCGQLFRTSALRATHLKHCAKKTNSNRQRHTANQHAEQQQQPITTVQANSNINSIGQGGAFRPIVRNSSNLNLQTQTAANFEPNANQNENESMQSMKGMNELPHRLLISVGVKEDGSLSVSVQGCDKHTEAHTTHTHGHAQFIVETTLLMHLKANGLELKIPLPDDPFGANSVMSVDAAQVLNGLTEQTLNTTHNTQTQTHTAPFKQSSVTAWQPAPSANTAKSIPDTTLRPNTSYEQTNSLGNNSYLSECLYCECLFANPRESLLHFRSTDHETAVVCSGMTPLAQPRALICLCCPKSFDTKSKLERHLLTHTQAQGTNHYQCSQCPRAYAQHSGLRQHVKVMHPISSEHANQSVIACVFCGNKYAYKCNLTRHMKTCQGQATGAGAPTQQGVNVNVRPESLPPPQTYYEMGNMTHFAGDNHNQNNQLGQQDGQFFVPDMNPINVQFEGSHNMMQVQVNHTSINMAHRGHSHNMGHMYNGSHNHVNVNNHSAASRLQNEHGYGDTLFISAAQQQHFSTLHNNQLMGGGNGASSQVMGQGVNAGTGHAQGGLPGHDFSLLSL